MKLVASGVPGTRQGLREDRGGDKVWPRRATESHQHLWKGPLWSSVGRCCPGNHSSGRRGQGHPRQPPDSPAVCNASTCPQSPPACGPGEKLVRTQVEDGCCPTFSCSESLGWGVGGWGWGPPGRRSASLLLPDPLLCTFNGTFYGVRAPQPGSRGRRRVGSGLSTSSEDPCAPLTTTAGGSRP